MAWDLLNRGRDIFVGIPHRGQVTTAWALNLLHAISPYLSRVRLFTIQGHPIDVSRGVLVEHALASEAKYIYFLDSDVYTSPDTLQRLLSHNLPIVSALYYRRHELRVSDPMLEHLPENIRKDLEIKRQVGLPIFTPAIWKDFTFLDEKNNELQGFRPIFDGEFSAGTVLEVDAIPMGCCLVKTEVFKQTPRPWFYWTLGRDASKQDDVSRSIQIREGQFGCSEDLYFSILARREGYKLCCDTSILVKHESQILVGSGGRAEVMEG